MPGFNHTGPKGNGPRTGKGQGRCKHEGNNSVENLSNQFSLAGSEKKHKGLKMQVQENENQFGGCRRRFGRNQKSI
jgi:hypothetical protein